MRIISTGSALPQRVITNDFLRGLGVSDEDLQRFPVERRPTVLPLDYIVSTLNREPKNTQMLVEGPTVLEDETSGSLAEGNVSVESSLVESPTSLGVAALKDALCTGGISIEDVGLIVADTSSQLQTIPCESQRIAAHFGVKVASYDFSVSSCAFVNHLRTFSKWKPEKLPKYIACIWVHTPTRFIDFSQGLERVIFGDGASAAIIASGSERAGWQLERTYYKNDVAHSEVITLPLFGHITCDFPRVKGLVGEHLRLLLKSYPPEDGDIFVLPPLGELDGVLREFDLGPDRCFSMASDFGFCMGAYPGLVFAKGNERFHAAGRVRVLVAEPGFSFGEAVFMHRG
jgi:3-oxoacyl-[acyl-carrier-protein] synthase III